MEAHYADLKDKKFFPGLILYMTSGPVCAMVWEGKNVVKEGRKMLGATMPGDSACGTIRGDFWYVVIIQTNTRFFFFYFHRVHYIRRTLNDYGTHVMYTPYFVYNTILITTKKTPTSSSALRWVGTYATGVMQ